MRRNNKMIIFMDDGKNGGNTWKLHDNPLRVAVVIVDARNVFFNVFFHLQWMIKCLTAHLRKETKTLTNAWLGSGGDGGNWQREWMKKLKSLILGYWHSASVFFPHRHIASHRHSIEKRYWKIPFYLIIATII